MKAAGATAAIALSLLGLSVSPAYADDGVRGAACQPGQGVTVAVDYSLDGSNADIRCAPGATGTVLEAFQAAGFDVAFNNTAYGPFVTGIDGTDAVTAFGAEGWWSLYTSTTTGYAAGPASDTWVSSMVGAGDAPVSTGQAYLFQVFDSYSCPSSTCVVAPALADLGLGTAVVPSQPSAVHGSADAGLAAAWIAGQLAAHQDVAASNGVTDWGLTIDTVFALASAGVGGDQIAATAAKLDASGSAYIGTASTLGTNWPAVAKLALGLEVAGVDPTQFATPDGTRNLIADLRFAMNADGSFGDAGTDNVFSHPLAMLALARTDGGVPPQAIAWMTAQQCTDATSANLGSYGWSPDCSSPDPDSSALAVQALSAAGLAVGDPVQVAAKAWLASQQGTSGGVASFGTANANSTGLVAQALAGDDAVTAAATSFIGGLQISCDTVAGHPALSDANLGAIAFDQTGFGGALADGLDAGTALQFLRASAQAVFGLGGPDFGSLSAAGVSAGVPAVSCATPPAPVEPAAPAVPAAPTVDRQVPAGGTAPAQGGQLIWIAIGCLAAGAYLLRRTAGSR